MRKAELTALDDAASLPVQLEQRQGRARASTHATALDGRVEALDMLRGLMALAVAVYHMAVWTRVFENSPARGAVVVLGIYSVQGFFIVSGFCFFALYRDQRWSAPELGRFHVRRFLRIAPLYYLAIALTYLADQAVNPIFSWGRLLENLTLSFGMFHPNHAMVLGGWSIGIEYLFYLALPLLLWLTRRPGMLYALLALLGAAALPITFDTRQSTSEFIRFHDYVQIPNHAFLFLLGAAIADLRARSAVRLPWPFVVVALACLYLVAARYQPEWIYHSDLMLGFTRVGYVALCAATVAGFALAAPPSGLLRRPLLELGALSYSVYLMHPFAYFAVTGALTGSSVRPGPLLAASLCATLVFAKLTHTLIERPAIDLGRRLTRGRTAAVGGP